jgi:L-ascorbate metabolism protein UlaG (beta-lactamase superfamily)
LHHEAGAPFPKHFDGKRFFNPGVPPPPGFRDVLRWMLTGSRQPSPRFVDDVEPAKPPASVAAHELRVTLVNHSTVLLQLGGGNILTDPIWSERATPVPGIGPRRRRAPGVLFEDLPRIDTVLLSHNHYDHLDIPTLRRLAERGHSQFVVPARVARLLQSHKIGPVHELGWGESLSLDGNIVHAAPAIHFSARGIFDRNETLWCGYVIEGPGSMVYFAGDTAFGWHFEAIRDRFGAPHLALLPIGAYEPRWFMSPVHMGPEDAMSAHEILGARTSIAIHHGTFQLGDEALDAPRRRLRECVHDDSFIVLNNGQSWTSTHSR